MADSIMTAACGDYLVKLWGRVTIIDSGSFWLNDGSGIQVKVIAPGYSGIADGDFASARGVLHPNANPPTLTCPADKVMKLD